MGVFYSGPPGFGQQIITGIMSEKKLNVREQKVIVVQGTPEPVLSNSTAFCEICLLVCFECL